MNFIFSNKGKFSLLFFSLFLIVVVVTFSNYYSDLGPLERQDVETEELGPLNEEVENKKARQEYYFNMLRDPKTNSIPEAVRARELRFANDLFQHSKAKSGNLFNWQEAGPNVVGGRTRAIAVDVGDPTGNTVIAGAASGGIWKSTNGGASWDYKSDPNHNLSVTSISQDPNNTNVWYYSAGEISGNTASGRLGSASYYGFGIWKSTNSGESWTNVTINEDGVGDASWNSPFDYISKVMVNPVNSDVYVATNGFGLYKSTNGVDFQNVYGSSGEFRYLDFDIDTQGNIVLIASESTAGESTANTGVFYTTNNGASWTNITPSEFPIKHARSVIDIAPSAEHIVYIFTNTGLGKVSNVDPKEIVEKLALFKINTKTGESFDLSANIPELDIFRGTVQTQGNFNMALAISPIDTNLVIVGGISLFRSKDGFTSTNFDRIGGYGVDNHHPDNHTLAFDPQNPERLWSGHDGGISLTNSASGSISWLNKNNGYNVTQFYTVSIAREAGDTRIIGGTQDNGSPYFRLNDTNEVENDISTGDGSFAFIGNFYMYVSSQEGRMLRVGYYEDTGEPLNPFGNKYDQYDWSFMYPAGASNQAFVHPFAVNPINQNMIFYPDGAELWKTTRAGFIQGGLQEGSNSDWTKLPFSAGAGYNISALSFTQSTPSHKLYFAASSNSGAPRIYFLENTSQTPTEISIPGTTGGSKVHQIAVNPLNGNELIVVMSNYNIVGTYYSSNGGVTWTAIEGNLIGDSVNIGPSIRSAAIAQGNRTTAYVLGTSTGVYTTTTLSGNNTIWTKESPEIIGSSIAEAIDYRSSDQTIAIGTHGRGIFIGTANNAVANEDETVTEVPNSFSLSQNYPNPFNPTTNIEFNLPSSAKVTLTVYDVNGRLVATILNNSQRMAGQHAVSFNAENLASGVYLYEINAVSVSGKSFAQSKKMTLIK
tara:strand:- start:9541 stop:12348 length:2808 start_codon:yes stop_codon:yes gene_type:complete